MTSSNPLPRMMRVEEFAPLKGMTFLAHCNPDPAPIRLIDVIANRNLANLERPPFTLVFHTSPAVLLIAGSYVMKCGDNFGPDFIYIDQMLPPAQDRIDGYYYQAVFN